MISYKTFERSINFVSREFELENKLYDVFSEYDDVIFDVNFGSHQSVDVVVNLLSESFSLKDDGEYGNDLLYWLFECDCGKNFQRGCIVNDWLPEDHKYHEPELSNLRDLYNYLVFLSEEKIND